MAHAKVFAEVFAARKIWGLPTGWDCLFDGRILPGPAQRVGRALRYVVVGSDGRWLAVLGWSSPALRLRPRDRWLV
jgi:hypothetical protein